jgi:malate permease and related proteins
MIAVAAAVAVSVALGIGAHRRFGEAAERAGRAGLLLSIYAIAPPVVFLNIARLHFTVDVVGGLALGWAMLVCVAGAAWAVGRLVLHLPRPAVGAVICSAVQANTGFVGLPVIAATLGTRELGHGIAWDAAVTWPMLTLGVFGIGAMLGTRAGETLGERLRAFLLRNPILYALVAGLVAPAGLAPDALVDGSRIAVLAFVPVGFFAVGTALAAEARESGMPFPPPLTRPVAVCVALRLLVAPALLWALAAPVIDLPDAYLLQAAMPTGVNVLTVAHVYGLDLGIPAATIAWSTALVLMAGVAIAAV